MISGVLQHANVFDMGRRFLADDLLSIMMPAVSCGEPFDLHGKSEVLWTDLCLKITLASRGRQATTAKVSSEARP